jgi:protein involved in polysaccharide export with SLBB domain
MLLKFNVVRVVMLKRFKFLLVMAGCYMASFSYGQTGDISNTELKELNPQSVRNGRVISNVIVGGNTSRADNSSLQGVAPKRENDQPLDLPNNAVAPNLVVNEFQKFVADAIGKSLPLFGGGFFLNSSRNFSPAQNSPVPGDYVLGVGDEVVVKGWGGVEFDIRSTIDRNGFINIPTVGSIALAGVSANDAENVIKREIDRLYKGVKLNVGFGQLKAITVYVVGQANRPGSYVISSFSTLVNALFASGGPNANGSLRHIQVKRNGNLVGELDLYAFIAKGDKSGDIRLRDGDTIFIPAAFGFAAVTGKVNTPAVYELHSAKDTIESILELAGGIPVVADPRRVFLERIDPYTNHPRTVEEFALNSSTAKKNIKTGDILDIKSITPDFSNAITLRGNVDQPLRVPYKPEMRIRDLIPSKEFLITRAAFARLNSKALQSDSLPSSDESNSMVSQIGKSFDDINWDYASVERIDPLSLRSTLLTFNLGLALDAPDSSENLLLLPGDVVTVFSHNEIQLPLDKRQVFVRIEGEVKAPGVYQMSQSETLQDLIARAGGVTDNAYLFGTEFYRQEVRKAQELNLQKVAQKFEDQLRAEQIRSAANLSLNSGVDAQLALIKRQTDAKSGAEAVAKVKAIKPTGRIAFSLEPSDAKVSSLPRIKLENGDRLVVPNRSDFVNVFGAVNQESSFVWSKGSNVESYLKRSGLSLDSDIENVFILRVDGTVFPVKYGWLSGIENVQVMPGDTIVVPEKLDKQSTYTRVTSSLKDWAQILSGFGLGAAAIKTLK